MNQIIDFIKEFVTRLQKESPSFFKKLRLVSLILMIAAWGMLAYDTWIGDFIPANWENFVENAGYIISAVFGFTWTPVKDKK